MAAWVLPCLKPQKPQPNLDLDTAHVWAAHGLAALSRQPKYAVIKGNYIVFNRDIYINFSIICKLHCIWADRGPPLMDSSPNLWAVSKSSQIREDSLNHGN